MSANAAIQAPVLMPEKVERASTSEHERAGRHSNSGRRAEHPVPSAGGRARGREHDRRQQDQQRERARQRRAVAAAAIIVGCRFAGIASTACC